MKKSWRILFTVLWLILAAASCRAVFQESDWPVQYYDLNHTGYSTAYSRDHIENLSLLYLFDAGSDVSSPVAADINGDNKTEILLGSQNKTLYALDPEANVLWTYETNGSVTTPGIYDIYGDGKYEILFGSGDGRIYLIDSGGKEIWNLSTNGSIKQSPVAVNLDAWPQKEIVAASSDENLYVIDYQGKIMKSYSLFDDPTTIPSFGDFDKDNKTDIFVGSVNDRVDVIGFPGLMRWSYNAQGAVNGVIAYDYNRDGKTDVVITSADGNIYSLSYTQHGSAESVKKCDNDGTCKDEPLTVSTLGKDWAYKTGGEIVSPPVLADIDGDYAKEIIAGSRDKTLYILNTTGQVKQTYTVNGRILASPAVADLDGDGKAEIAFGSDDGSLYVINSTGYAEWGYKTKDPIDQSPILADINNDGNLEILAASGSKLYIFGTKPEEKPPEPTTTTTSMPATTTTTTTSTTTAYVTTTTENLIEAMQRSFANLSGAGATTTTTGSTTSTAMAKESIDLSPLNFVLFMSEYLLIIAVLFVAGDTVKDRFSEKKPRPAKKKVVEQKVDYPVEAIKKALPANEDPYMDDMEKILFGVDRGEDTDIGNPNR